jgi:hypothetical protein
MRKRVGRGNNGRDNAADAEATTAPVIVALDGAATVPGIASDYILLAKMCPSLAESAA